MNSVVDAFETVVERHPKAIAIEDHGKRLTYKQLHLKALGIAGYFQNQGFKKGDIVALRMDKSSDYIASLLACWYLGAVFVPLDPELPETRTKYILSDSGAKFLVGLKVDFVASVIFLDLKSAAVTAKALTLVPEDSAYLIYTSGSTGKPKGVEVTHAGLLPMLTDQINAFGLKLGMRSLFILSISFDASLSDMGTAILSGATLVIEPPCRLHVFNLYETIEAKKINYIDLPPSLLTHLDPADKPKSLQTIVIGGEICPAKTVRKWASELTLINVYGPTEATVCTSLIRCNSDWNKPLIGQPLTHVVYKVSVTGELLISGPGLAKGYIKQPTLTEDKFIFEKGIRWYCTGDRVKLLDNGEYLFLGRLDHQVKLRGKLIELDEIVNRINELSFVNDSYILKYEEGRVARLVACVEVAAEKISNVRDHLKKYVPQWMVPAQFIGINKLPRNASNKVNVVALKTIIKEKSWQSRGSLSDLFFTYLGEYFDEDSDFSEVGIDSFSLMEISQEAISCGMTLSPSLMAESRNLRNLKNKLKTGDVTSKMAASRLRKNADLEFHKIQILQPEPSSMTDKPQVLLTGATGTLGREVLVELLQYTESKITCLIRCKSAAEGWVRLFQEKRDLQKYKQRIKVISGDISRIYLGVGETEYLRLLESINTVYHCAAEVNALKSYEQLYCVNVKGVVEILKFCIAGKPKRLNYASTLSVFVSSDKNEGVLKEDDDLSAINDLYGGYSQTKFCAELILQKAQQKFSAINVFRFGLITPDQDRVVKSSVDFLQLFIREAVAMGCRPKSLPDNIEIDITPVDFAAKAFVEIGQTSQGARHAWHIANNKSLSLDVLYDEIEKTKRLEKVSFSDWSERVLKFSPKSVSFLLLCRLREEFEQFRTMDLFQASDVIFDMSKSLAVLQRKKITIPEINSKLIQRYIEGVQ